MANQGTRQEGHFVTTDVIDDAVVREAKTGGQVRGVSRMLQEGRHCVDVLAQIESTRRASGRRVPRDDAQLPGAVPHRDAIKGGDPLIYDELMSVLFRHR